MNPNDGLPDDWTIRISRTHDHEYFYNTVTGESQWDAPEGTDEDKLQEYLGKNLHRPTKVRVSHILVKHKDSRRPSSWKEDKITRTKEEAIEILEDYKNQLDSGEKTFAELATESSDCSSHSKGGDLDYFGRGMMQPSFERAAFGLQVGDMSPVVESDSGVHLILRTA